MISRTYHAFREDAIRILEDEGFVYYHGFGWCNLQTEKRAMVDYSSRKTRPWCLASWKSDHMPEADSPHMTRRLTS